VDDFEKLGYELDDDKKKMLKSGVRIKELMKKGKYVNMEIEEKVDVIYCGVRGKIEKMEN
jgi:F0F1-type ATP synthase alpha subunit